MRQESFAGRPSDIDLGIKEDQHSKLLDAIPLFKKIGAVSIRRQTFEKLAKLQILFPFILVDIGVFCKKNGTSILSV